MDRRRFRKKDQACDRDKALDYNAVAIKNRIDLFFPPTAGLLIGYYFRRARIPSIG
jgi:hypothetical protein